jgi:hypothetical protein
MPRRDQVLTIRLCNTELALIAAIRQGCPVLPSQADVVTWAMEDLCARIAAGEDCNIVLKDGARERCAQVLDQFRADRHCTFQGRPPRTTGRDRSINPSPDSPNRFRPAVGTTATGAST